MENIEDIYQLAPIQEGLLFHTLYEPHSAMYIEQFSYTIQGQFDVAAFRRAWQLMIARHQVLRAGFFWEDLDAPLQVVQKQAELPFALLDWRQLPPAEQDRQHAELLAADRAQGFDLAKAPLMRITVIRMAENRYQVIWTHHHLLLDGWSSAILLRELFTAYAACAQNLPLPLPPTRPYGDYIAWLQEQDLDQAERFWRRYLAGFSAPTPFGVDHPPRALPEGQPLFDTQELPLTTETTARLQALARQQQLTLSGLLQGAWAILLSYYSGERDIVFGATSVGRPPELDGIESMIGLFINTLPTRFRVDPASSLLVWLKSHLLEQAELRQYEYTPLVRIQGWSEVPRGLPLFESMIVLDNYPAETSAVADSLSSIQIVGLPTTFEQTNYPLTVVGVSGPALTLRMLYDRRRFDDPLIRRMLLHFQALLEQIAQRPESRLGELSPLSAAERQQVLHGWNATERSYPREGNLPQFFEQQAARTPDAIAVESQDACISYDELNRRANQLAHHLQALGVGPETLVCVCMERSIDLIVALLGVLKAGGAYVPLDPSYPASRLSYMLADTGAPVLITQSDLLPSLPAQQATTICLDAAPSIAAYPPTNPAQYPAADHLAYVIYTSGSTGRPKGVPIVQHSVLNLVGWHQRSFALSAADRATLLAGPAFDASVWEIWPALLTGATLCIPDDETRALPERLHAWLCEQRITISFVPTPIAEHLISASWLQRGSLRVLLTGGDRLQRHPSAPLPFTLVNNYGPTEGTVVATSGPVPDQATATTAAPLIGRPIDNSQILILGPEMQPLPVGVAGEIYLGSVGLSRGYLKRPDLTAEKFVPHPFSGTPGARLYRTGDLARFQPDGQIEFLGRIDQQVQVRGFRVELGEIETVLRGHSAVRETIVLARNDERGETRLVAYVVAENNEQANNGTTEQREDEEPQEPSESLAAELRALLQEQLPDYMVPAAFVFLQSLPLTANGKIDRSALPEPELARPGTSKSYVAPRESYELQLVQIWEEVLGLRPIGVTDTFFELGGHSMSAVRLMSRVRSQFGQQLPLSALFESPTVEALAQVLRDRAAGMPWSPLVALQANGSRPPLFCVHPGGGTIVCYLPLAQQLDPEQPVYGVQAFGLYGDQQPLARVEDMAAAYIAALREVQPEGPYMLGGWSAGGVIAFEMAQQLSAQGEQVELLALIDAGRPVPSAAESVEDERELVRQVADGLNLTLELPEDLEPDELLRRILEQARLEAKVPPDISLDEGRRLVRLNHTITQAVRRYVPAAYSGRVVLFRSSELPADLPADAVLPPQDLGWSELVQGGVEVISVPGNHLTMVEMPQVAVLAERLQACLDRAQALDMVGIR
jgi:surfactin family lipopeptide synthetase C